MMQDPLHNPGIDALAAKEHSMESMIEAIFLLDCDKSFTEQTAGFDQEKLVQMLTSSGPDLLEKLNLS